MSSSVNDEIGGRIIISSSVNDWLMEDITSIKMVVLSHGYFFLIQIGR